VGRTLVICKPDAVERGLVGEIVTRIERKGLRLVAAELRSVTAELAMIHYAEHAGQPFFDPLVAFITRSPVMAMVVEGPDDTVSILRNLIGATNPVEAAPGTVRGDLALVMSENLIHGSDSPEAAVREIGLFFPSLA
jgi:nucleoside-diphosphate kinase